MSSAPWATLSTASWIGTLLMRSDGAELATFDEPRGAIALAWPFEAKPPASGERGGEEPPGAFSEPFGPAFVDGFRAKLRLSLEAKATPPDPEQTVIAEVPERSVVPDALGYTAGGVAVLFAAGTAWQATVASQTYGKYLAAHTDEEVERYEGDVRAARHRAIAFGVTAGVTAIGSALLFLLWD
jgi:hypothetical protein